MCARYTHTRSGQGSKILASVAKWSKNIHSKFQVCSYHIFKVLKPKFGICAKWPLFSDPVTIIDNNFCMILHICMESYWWLCSEFDPQSCLAYVCCYLYMTLTIPFVLQMMNSWWVNLETWMQCYYLVDLVKVLFSTKDLKYNHNWQSECRQSCNIIEKLADGHEIQCSNFTNPSH